MAADTSKTLWAIDPIHTRIRFEAKYLMITSVSGWFREFEGTVSTENADFSNSEISLTVYSNSLYTGIDDRDNHLRSADFFDTRNFPTIEFRSSEVLVNGSDITVTGTLTIKGVSQTITFKAKYIGCVRDPNGNLKAGFEADALFDRKDFNITWNQFFDKQGILIGDQVSIHADVQLLRLEAASS
jgi:polyisoprenoid-binding protein YceI